MKALLIILLIAFSYSQNECPEEYPNTEYDMCCKYKTGTTDIDECVNCQVNYDNCYKCKQTTDTIIFTYCEIGYELKESEEEGVKITACAAFSSYLISGIAVLIALITLL